MDRLRVLSGHFGGAAEASGDKEGINRTPTLARARTSQFPQAQNMKSFPPPSHDVFALDDLLTEEERDIRYKVRKFAEQELAPIAADYWERAAFPFQILPKLRQLNLGGATLKGHGCAGQSTLGAAMAVIELARVDASVSTFLMVHNSLAMLTIGLLGSEEQKQELLPAMARLESVGCWALTEPSNGSDASGLATTARRVKGGWVLNGQKRWIGNATFADVVVVWARNLDTQQVNCFIVKKGTTGFNATKIENKIALRCVQNGDLTFEQCFVPGSARLPGVNSFQDTNKVLAVSRIMVAWQPIGMCQGVYDMCVRYTAEREQFGAPIGSFQLQQERLARMLGTIQAMTLMAWRLSKLADEGRMTHAMASTVKAWNTLRAREVMAAGREMLGGNGVVSDFLVAKAFCDLEAIHTYEGTYDVNVLVSGRVITGQAAFKPPPKRKSVAVKTAEGQS